MVAARKGSVEIVKKLIQHGANVNLTDKVAMETKFIVIIMGARLNFKLVFITYVYCSSLTLNAYTNTLSIPQSIVIDIQYG